MGVQWGFSGGRGAKGQTLGGLKGSKGASIGGGGDGGGGLINGIFLQFEFRFRNELSRTLALQNFRILAKFLQNSCKIFHDARNKKKSGKNPF